MSSINILVIGKRDSAWNSGVSVLWIPLPAACMCVITLQWQRAQIFWGGGDHAMSLKRSAASASPAVFSHSGTSDAWHDASPRALVGTRRGRLDLHAVYRFFMTVGLKRLHVVDASKCLNQGSETRPKYQIGSSLSCGCAVTVLPQVAPEVCEVYDSSLRFYGFSFLRVFSLSSKWKDSSRPCANGSTACRKTVGKNPSWLTREITATWTPTGKVFG